MQRPWYKIFFFTISLRKGGAENQLVKLAISLKKKGYDVSIISLMDGDDFGVLLAEQKIKVVNIKVKEPFGLLRLFRLIKQEKPDIVISFMFGANLIGRLVKLWFKVPLITSVRNNEISKFYKTLYRVSYKIDSITTFNSEFAFNKFIKEDLSDAKRSFMVPNAITFDKSNDQPLMRKNYVFTLVSIAHFRPQKDYRSLFHAIKLVTEKGLKIRLIVLGHLFNQTWPKELLNTLGIEQIVTLVGFTNDTKAYINESDALVLSSLWEGTPNAILEGMANKLPIIASDIPGNRELIHATNGGLLFEKQNIEELCDRIIELYNSPNEIREEMGKRGYSHVMEHYEETKVHDYWEDIILQAIENS